MTFDTEYYPHEIVDALCRASGSNPNSKEREEYNDAMNYLLVIAENEYNDDCYRKLYRLLERVAECQ